MVKYNSYKQIKKLIDIIIVNLTNKLDENIKYAESKFTDPEEIGKIDKLINSDLIKKLTDADLLEFYPIIKAKTIERKNKTNVFIDEKFPSTQN